jgi:hypothetical protein
MYLNHAILTILAFSLNFFGAVLILNEIMETLKEKTLSSHINTLLRKHESRYRCTAHTTPAKSSVVFSCMCSEPLSPEQRHDTFNVHHALGKKVGLDKNCHRNHTWTISSCPMAIMDSQTFTTQCLPVKKGTPVSSSIMKQSMPNYILDQ